MISASIISAYNTASSDGGMKTGMPPAFVIASA
jgi:hypothetical protein